MGVCLALCTLSDENIERVRANPSLMARVVSSPEDGSWTPPSRPGWLARLFGARDEPAGAPGTRSDAGFGEVEHSDVDKAWHGLHFLLTGTEDGGEPPLNALLAGGEDIEGDGLESGARLLSSAQVQALNEALGPIDEAWLRKRYDPAAMAALSLYPKIWHRADQHEENFDYLLYQFEQLKAFVAKAADRGLGLAIYFS